MAGNVKLHLTRDHSFDYQPSDPAGYYFMFTGGYAFAQGPVTDEPPGDEDADEAADEVRFAQETDRWIVELDDDTGQDFRIVRYRPRGSQLDEASLDPPPDTDLEPSKSLTIEVSDLPSDFDAERFRGFKVTLENEDGERIELDPSRGDEGD